MVFMLVARDNCHVGLYEFLQSFEGVGNNIIDACTVMAYWHIHYTLKAIFGWSILG
jgi:hypothetical protein